VRHACCAGLLRTGRADDSPHAQPSAASFSWPSPPIVGEDCGHCTIICELERRPRKDPSYRAVGPVDTVTVLIRIVTVIIR
jgi:hypothetical protein